MLSREGEKVEDKERRKYVIIEIWENYIERDQHALKKDAEKQQQKRKTITKI